MKKNLLKLLTLSCLLIISLASCASTKKENTDPNFLGDYDPFYVGEIAVLNKQNMFSPKPKNVTIDFYPRTSSFSATLKDGMNHVKLVFKPEEVEKLSTAIDTYLALYESEGFDPNHKPNRKNNFNKGNVYTYWGVFGTGREALGTYKTNYEYYDGNPYFKLEVWAEGNEEEGGSISVDLFVTPNQLEKLLQITNMDLIKEEIEDLNEAAYGFN